MKQSISCNSHVSLQVGSFKTAFTVMWYVLVMLLIRISNNDFILFYILLIWYIFIHFVPIHMNLYISILE